MARGARCAVPGNPPWHVAPDVRRFLVKTRRCAAVSGTGRPKCGESRSHFACLVPNATIDYRTSKPTCHQAASEADGRLHAPAPIGPDAPSAGRSRPPHGALRRALDAARRTYRNAGQRAPATRHDKPSQRHYAPGAITSPTPRVRDPAFSRMARGAKLPPLRTQRPAFILCASLICFTLLDFFYWR